jgi:hypothetical protein
MLRTLGDSFNKNKLWHKKTKYLYVHGPKLTNMYINLWLYVKYVQGSKLVISICDWMCEACTMIKYQCECTCEVCTRIIISNINLWLDVWSMYNDQISICDWMCEVCTMIKYQFVIACVKHAQWSNINLWLHVWSMYNDQISMWVYVWSMY